FYTAQARARNNPPRVELSRLTGPQYDNALADLIASFVGLPNPGDARGLSATYYNDRKPRGDKKVFDRVDAAVDFQFGAESPGKGLDKAEFCTTWRGVVLTESTGEYEFAVKTENGVQLWVNDMTRPLVDAYVASGGKVEQHEAPIRLLGGRAYALKIEWFKYKDKTASIQLLWKPPRKAWQVVPTRCLAPDQAPAQLVISRELPPDDSSLGYARGAAVSKAWDEATTDAAVEVANYVVDHLRDISKCPPDAGDRRERLAAFCRQFAERAFRRPLSDEQRERYVDAHFGNSDDMETAVKQSILLTLKSPYFLYTNLPREGGRDGYQTAARLALALWDSLPDAQLTSAAAADQLQTREQIISQVQRMMRDRRAKAKMQSFFAHWLPLDATDELTKDEAAFPDFDAAVVADLRTSLELFVSDVFWSDASDFRSLLLADQWYVNDRLARLYSVKLPDGEGEFRKTTEGDERAGVMTHPFLLSALAYHGSSSPIHRGVFVTRKILCRQLKPPPMAIEFKDSRFDPHLTMREKVSQLTSPAACQSCHVVINPLGFSLENYDAIGRYRTEEQGKPIDTAGEYPTVDGAAVRLSGARTLAQFAADDPDAQRGFIEHLFHHIVKQASRAYGAETPDELHAAFARSNYNTQNLVAQVALSAAAS
ncbi:MAG: DUF1592 domain-containing protein, partial [Planctomycetales bacterium]|nr:DUF1592 domain-containing protein [Planctomycetales bacterium]